MPLYDRVRDMLVNGTGTYSVDFDITPTGARTGVQFDGYLFEEEPIKKKKSIKPQSSLKLDL